MFKMTQCVFASILLATSTIANAGHSVPMFFTVEKGSGQPAGKVEISQTKYGLLLTPQLQGLTPGIHGFHIHQMPSCDQNGMSAGGHFDPKHTEKHLGPYDDHGHLGDLPALFVNADGSATLPLVAPRIKQFSLIKNHALMIHEGGDNYADQPAKLGGGGARMVCGVIG